jgi:hypothetical protein
MKRILFAVATALSVVVGLVYLFQKLRESFPKYVTSGDYEVDVERDLGDFMCLTPEQIAEDERLFREFSI